MNSRQLVNAVKVGRVVVGTKPVKSSAHVAYSTPLVVEYDATFPKTLKRKHLSIVYFIFVNDVLYKIGQTSGKSGIQGCMQFYMNAGLDDPGANRFAINFLMREELAKGNKVEIYMQYHEPIQVTITSMLGTKHVIEAPIDAKEIEAKCTAEYVATYGQHPLWNYQEAGEEVPLYISEAFAKYRTDRAASKKGNRP